MTLPASTTAGPMGGMRITTVTSKIWNGEPCGMSLATFSLGDPSIAQVEVKDGGKRPPPKRSTTAVADQKLAPEPR